MEEPVLLYLWACDLWSAPQGRAITNSLKLGKGSNHGASMEGNATTRKVTKKWNLVLQLGNLGYSFGRIFVLPNIVGRTHCQQSLIPQICLNFDVWHMNFNNDMTSMRKKNSLLLSSPSRQLWEAAGWLTGCSEERVSSMRVSATCKLHQRTRLAPYLGAGKPAIPPDGIRSQIPADSSWRQTLIGVPLLTIAPRPAHKTIALLYMHMCWISVKVTKQEATYFGEKN